MNQKVAMNLCHPEYLGWQMDWPLYVKCPILRVYDKVFKRGDYFPWSEMQVSPEKVSTLYKSKLVYHDATKTQSEGYGDRLGEIGGKNLNSLAALLNQELKKKHTANETDFKRKRCRQSTIADTQRRFIRQFLSKNPYMVDYFLEVRDQFIVKKAEAD